MHDLAGAYGFGVNQILDTWHDTHRETGVGGYVIDVEASPVADNADGTIIAVAHRLRTSGPAGDVIHATLVIDVERLAQQFHTDVGAGQRTLADSIVAVVDTALSDRDRDRIRAAWLEGKPTLAVKIMRSPTVRPELRRAWPPDESLLADVDRKVAEAVQKAGVEPGVFTGRAAKDLDRDVLAPAAYDILTARLARHAAADLILTGAEQLERVIAGKQRDIRDLEQSARSMTLHWDPADRLRMRESDYLILRRFNEIAVEATLRLQPTGNVPVDRLAWADILAAASAYLFATMRSEAVHHQIRPSAIEITDSYEIQISVDHGASPDPNGAGQVVYDLDIEAFQKARAAASLAGNGGQDNETRTDAIADAANPVDGGTSARGKAPVPPHLDKVFRTRNRRISDRCIGRPVRACPLATRR